MTVATLRRRVEALEARLPTCRRAPAPDFLGAPFKEYLGKQAAVYPHIVEAITVLPPNLRELTDSELALLRDYLVRVAGSGVNPLPPQ
jgi:hypothetical protein